MGNRILKISVIAVIVGLVPFWTASALAAETLTSVETSAAPVLDGKAEAAWNKAKALEVVVDKLPYEPSNGYPGVIKSRVSLRAMHDAENLYMLIEYDDPTQSLERFPWIKQADGTWQQKSNKDSTKHENTYYEDKFAVLWDINARGFAKKGCGAACHMADNGMNEGIMDTAPGRKFTARPGQTIDMWHWKSVRSWPVGQIDDQFIDDTKDPSRNKNWGRKGDTKTGGGYKNNVSEDGNMPIMMSRSGATGEYWLHEADAVEFKDNFKTGDMVPGIIVSPFEGPRADILAEANYANGKWTIELTRKLKTTGENSDTQDIQFTDMSKSYPFGIAVFDNSQINHIYHEGVMNLKFGN